ncbi:MAG: peptidase U32 family protein, partial [Desulfocucumaceae bacterium]
GDCAQSCRWRYFLMEEKRPGQYFPVLEDDRGTYVLSSRDLCLLPHLPELVGAGVHSFKIEGRVKSVHYVATVVKVYREAIDLLAENPRGFKVDPGWLEELGKVSNREYTTGFIAGEGDLAGHGDVEGIYVRNCVFVGIVKGYDPEKKIVRVEQRNRFFRGETLEVLGPSGPPVKLRVEELFDEEGQALEAAPHPCQTVLIPVDAPVAEYSLLRRLND